jgi:hypothetical protein
MHISLHAVEPVSAGIYSRAFQRPPAGPAKGVEPGFQREFRTVWVPFMPVEAAMAQPGTGPCAAGRP